ncbi:MAG: portal protein [Desulfatibacillaceae bacterium]
MHTTDSLIRRHEALGAERARWESTWQDILDHVLPRRAGILGADTPGARRGAKVYDSTPTRALVRLAAALNSMLTNPASRWFHLEVEDPEQNARQETRAWLEQVATAIQRGLEASNFATEVHETYLDLGCLGTACMFMEEGADTDFNFSTRHIREVYVAEDDKGRVDTVFRKFSLTARQMLRRWGADACGERIAEQARKKPEDRRDILHCVLPRDEWRPGRAGRENLPWASVWVDLETRRRLDEGGYHEFPYCVPRWLKASGEKYGRSPALDALADIRTLNAMARTLLVTGEKVANPPLNVPDENTCVKNTPGGINYYDTRTMARIEPIAVGANLPLNFEMIREKRDAVADAFFANQLQLIDSRRMTAEEVRARVAENLRVLGPTFGRLQSEFFAPVVARCYGILLRNGKLPEPPASLAGQPIAVRYKSPLARSQRAHEAQAVSLLAGTALDWARTLPEVLDNVDLDAAIRALGEMDGVPAELLRPVRQRDAMRKRRAALEEMRTRLALTQGLAQANRTQAESYRGLVGDTEQ